jgi:hypothetical protein
MLRDGRVSEEVLLAKIDNNDLNFLSAEKM